MHLLDLPSDVITLLPYSLHSLDDLYSLLRTSKTLYNVCSNSRAKLPPRFAKKGGRSLFPPHPYLLLAGTARQVADWAVSDDDNRATLAEAFEGGLDGFYNLAVEVARLSIHDARELHRVNYELVKPLSRRLDVAVGPSSDWAWYTESDRQVEYEERMGRDMDQDQARLEFELDDNCSEWLYLEYPELALFNHWVYCELFHHTISRSYDPSSVTARPLSGWTRVLFLTYCIPDGVNELLDCRKLSHIDDQCYNYTQASWEIIYPSRKPIRFLELQRNLYGRLFGVEGIYKMLKGADIDEIEWEDDSFPIRGLSVEGFICTIIQHQPLLCMRLVLPGGLHATKEAISPIIQKINQNKPMYVAWRRAAAPAAQEGEDETDISGRRFRPWHSFSYEINAIFGEADLQPH